MINFIAKPPYEMRHLQRVSSIIRGEQIAAFMGNARLNPTVGNANDVYIYVKPHIKPGNEFDFPSNSWIDIQDGFDLRHTLDKYPDVGVIAFSQLDVQTLAKIIKNKIELIPHHHCNFERDRRERKVIKRVGITGSDQAFPHIPDVIRDGLKDRGIELIEYSQFYPRTSVARFHKSIDIHMQWRPWLNRLLSCPLKITNAASFGVPTIALDEPSYKEVEGCYLPVKTAEEWLKTFDKLRDDPELYDQMAKDCIEISEKYHIENIAKLYERLDQ